MLGTQANDLHSFFPHRRRGHRGSGSVTITKSWRIRALGASAAMVATVALAACGSSSGKKETTRGAGSGAVPEPTKPVTVTFASWVGSDPTMKKLAADFHREHP